jgi:hypothetical protein
VLEALAFEASAHGGLNASGATWIMYRGKHYLQTLKHQFGHMHEETTEIYLKWLMTSCGIAEMAAGWHRFLEDGSDV